MCSGLTLTSSKDLASFMASDIRQIFWFIFIYLKEWYIGTAADPKAQLFNVQGFKNGDKGLYRQAGSEIQAAEVAEFFTGMGAKGHKGVARGAEYVYLYKRAPHTKP